MASTSGKSRVADYPDLFFPNYGTPRLCLTHGKGSRVWDDSGREYLDFASGVATVSLGHSHPDLLEALLEQSKSLWHCSNFWTTPATMGLAQKLTAMTFGERAFFANSGTEAMECAVKLARRWHWTQGWPQRTKLVVFEGAFHGRTMLNIALGSKDAHREGYGLVPGLAADDIVRLPFNQVDGLEQAIGEETAAVIVEPIQGESGIWAANDDFMRELRAICSQKEALLVFDEVQSGNGRTGWLYAYQRYGVTPDILATAKGIAGGMPLGAVLTRADIAQCMQSGSHGSTFGGNPLACAVAAKALEIIGEEGFLHRVRAATKHLSDRLEGLCGDNQLFARFRVEGLWAAVDLVNPEVRSQLMLEAEKNGLLMLPAGESSIRLAPALNISLADLDEGVDRLEQASHKI